MITDKYQLDRFIVAQDPVFERVCAELTAGHKESHWMWFIFPQLRGLGSSATAQHFGVGSLEEARAYLAHPVLGQRLRACTLLVNGVADRSAQEIFGYPDYLKFRSSMTLFMHAAGEVSGPFREALTKYFAGKEDPRTRELLETTPRNHA